MKDLPKYLWRAGSTGAVNTIASALSVALLLPLIIHRVGLDAYGFFAMLAIFVGIGALLELGMSKALIYLVPRRPSALSELFSAALTICATGYLAFLIIGAILLVANVPVFGSAIEAQGNFKWWLCAAGCTLVASNIVTALVRGALEGAYKMHVVNLGFAALTIANYVVVFAATLISDEPSVLVAASACVFILMTVAHLVLARHMLALRWQTPERSTMHELTRVGFRSFVADAPSTMKAPILQYLFTLAARSGADYGVFDLALRIATLCGTALSSLSTPFFAVVAGSTRESADSVRRVIARHVRITVATAFAGWLAFILVGDLAIRLILPAAPPSLHAITAMVLAGSLAVAALEPWTRMQLGLGKQPSIALVRLAMLAASVLVALAPLALEPLYQFASAFVAGSCTLCLGLAYLHRRESWGRTRRLPAAETPSS
jgi:hypothetical protein